jgi:cytochrome b pre-mRNA-processing protein 3
LLSTSRHVAAFEARLPFRRNPIRDAADAAYGRVVEQSRRPAFFAALGVPDTLDGRFELICLHGFLYLRRLKDEKSPAPVLAQQFVDTIFADFDRSLREIGTGDLSVGRQVKRMAQAFYGRVRAYDEALQGGDAELAAALNRNLYGTAPASPEQLGRIAAYLRREAESLVQQPAADLTAGIVAFGEP